MKVKVKLYCTWHTWSSPKKAMNELLKWASHVDGAERDRYMDAYYAIANGDTEVDTDL